ncbi:hypothetical protein ACU42Y_13025 [Proteus mirabilis]
MVSDIKKAVFEVNGIVTMEALGAIFIDTILFVMLILLSLWHGLSLNQ